MQTKNGARHGFSLLYRVQASPIHTHPPTHSRIVCQLVSVVLCLLLVVVGAAGCVVCLVVVAVMKNAFVICPPLVMLMIMAVCVLFWCRKSQWSLFSWSLHIGYAVAAHLTSTAPKRLNNSKNLESQQGSLAFLHIDFSASRVHNVTACSAVENLLKRVLIFSWCASWQHHISHFYDRRDENTQPCSVLVLQDWLRHHRVIILGAINSGLTKHRSYLKCFCVWTLKHLRQTQVGTKNSATKRHNKTGCMLQKQNSSDLFDVTLNHAKLGYFEPTNRRGHVNHLRYDASWMTWSTNQAAGSYISAKLRHLIRRNMWKKSRQGKCWTILLRLLPKVLWPLPNLKSDCHDMSWYPNILIRPAKLKAFIKTTCFRRPREMPPFATLGSG